MRLETTMTKEETRHLQELINKVGGLLKTDDVSGRNTRRAIADARSRAGLPAGEEVEQALIDWLEAQPAPSPDLPTKGVTFIAREEVGGRDFYERHTAVPHWPGEASGITIGVGYDLRFSSEIFEGDWGDKLSDEALAALRPHLGKLGSKAEADALSAFRIPWTTAWQVFTGRSLPLQVDHTQRVYTTFDQLHGFCRSVLVSLVFNRGTRLTDMSGKDTRREMRTIRDLLKQGKLNEVPDQLLSMRRLWPNSRGLRERREREADLWREGVV
jgi:hypothetical protein